MNLQQLNGELMTRQQIDAYLKRLHITEIPIRQGLEYLTKLLFLR